MVSSGAFSSTLAWLAGSVVDVVAVATTGGGFAVFTAGGDGFAVFAATFGFGFAATGLGVNGAGFSSTAGPASAVLPKQPCDEHPSSVAYGGERQLQPINVAHSVKMRSVLMQFPFVAELRSHFLRRCDGQRRVPA